MEQLVADNLLQIKAIKLEPTNPFTWASGWKSPIYCDNRKILSYPAIRKVVSRAFVEKIRSLYPDVEIIAGVATGAIAIGMLVAEEMGLPFIYVRPEAKKHGLANSIEGVYAAGQRIVVIEDLISTGGSSIKAIEALRAAECNVLGMVAIFTYGFDVATHNFAAINCTIHTLSNYNALISRAVEKQYITQNDVAQLQEWRKNPAEWGV
ncbi:MAG: orotate phosphoribosyltransferase [Bacteroidales bacterium]|nr:orotate phosphoribosyltransferase [Bacteroidales bacterium]